MAADRGRGAGPLVLALWLWCSALAADSVELHSSAFVTRRRVLHMEAGGARRTPRARTAFVFTTCFETPLFLDGRPLTADDSDKLQGQRLGSLGPRDARALTQCMQG